MHPPFILALYEPEIPQNTGNIIRLCANTGLKLELIKPLGFALDDRKLKRAGLDYHEWANVHVHENFAAFDAQHLLARTFALTTKGQRTYSEIAFQKGDCFLFGPESRGLPAEVLAHIPQENHLRIPMCVTSRSLNLANSASILVYEALRQHGFPEMR